MRAAVIGIGSNSVRALVAQNNEGVFERLYRDREGTRLFAGLDSRGMLKEESILKTAEAVHRMAVTAAEKGAADLSIFATSAARDAVNGDDFLKAIEQAAGIPPVILSGEEEARLSFFGASRAVKDECFCGVIDIGGGSTEIVAGCGDDIECAFSCQMGAVRLFREIPIARKEDMVPVMETALKILEENLSAHGDGRHFYDPGSHGQGDSLDSQDPYARNPGNEAGNPADRRKTGRYAAGGTDPPARTAARTRGYCRAWNLYSAGCDGPFRNRGHHGK